MNREQNQLVTTPNSEALNLIRVETALSRYPIHRLSNKGTISINIRKNDDKGTALLRWEVDYSNKQGQPGPLAYKLDTLVINRRIEEKERPVPRTIRLGSLHEIAQELGLGRNTLAVRKALLQNVGAVINAKIAYRGADKTERTLEAAFTRYSAIFTGDQLPDGRRADAVYLVMNDIYLEVLNNATRRPLDYDYLRALSPGAQRFYEILSYEMLPAIRFNQRAKLPYSEFCMFSTMTRYTEFDQVKKQMYKVHQPHIRSGYIGQKVAFESTVDHEGKPDWNMFYTPAERAKLQQLVFSYAIPQAPRERVKVPPIIPEAKTAEQSQPPQAGSMQVVKAPVSNAAALVKRFYRLRYGRDQEPTQREILDASGYLAEGPDWADYLVEFAAQQGKEKDGFPNDFGGAKKLAAQAATPFQTKYKGRQAVALKHARQSHQEAHREAYRAFLGELLRGKLEVTLPEALAAFTAQESSAFQFHKSRAVKSTMSAQVIEGYYDDAARISRLAKYIEENPKSGLPTFWQWDEKISATPFDTSQVDIP